MAHYTRISKSRRMRYKVIQLTYLIFLILSVIQIPDNWIYINQHIYSYQSKPKVVYTSVSLEEVAKGVEKVESDLLKYLSFNQNTGKIDDPNNYTKSDKFFIEQKNGQLIFSLLVKLNNWVNQLQPNDKRRYLYKSLFYNDLKNGIESNDSEGWVKKRWLHIPNIIALNFLKEIDLRIKLMNYNNGNSNISLESSPLIAINNEKTKVKIDEEVYFTLKDNEFQKIRVFKDGELNFDYELVEGEKYLTFKAKRAGYYVVYLYGNKKTEKIILDVKPKGLENKQNIPLKICYSGIRYPLNLSFSDAQNDLIIEGDTGAKYNTKEIQFSTLEEKWCKVYLKSGNDIIISDSIHVKQIPDPSIYVENLPDLKISKRSLLENETFNLIIKDFVVSDSLYSIESFEAKWVCKENIVETIFGNKLNVPSGLTNLSHIILHNFKVKIGNKIRPINKPIIIYVVK